MSKEKVYKSERFQLYITIDREDMVLMASDYLLGEFDSTTSGRLLEAGEDLADELEKLFEIKVEEYGVERFEEESINFSN